MLIRYFKSSFYPQYLLLVLLAAGLWAGVLYHGCSQTETGKESPLFMVLTGAVGFNSLLGLFVGFILTLFAAFLLNFILIRHELLPKNGLIGALVFVILMSHPALALGMNPVITAGLFIVLAFDRILSTYGKADPTQEVFSAAFLSALASVIYFPSVVLILLLLISFVVFGTFSFRMLLVAVSGILAVYLYLFVFYFLNDQLEVQYEVYSEWIRTMPDMAFLSSGAEYVVWIMVLLMFIAAIMHLFSHLNEWNISVRKKALMTMWLVMLGVITVFYEGDKLPIALLLIMIPVSAIIAVYLASRKKPNLMMEIYLILIYLATLANNLFFTTC
ncbi:MAG TPA: DUF6427 family protein [Bacteroidales bacterium]|nr:DUF6427 family protein [Bacteroidales bacterium]